MNKFDLMRSKLSSQFKNDVAKQSIASRAIDHAQEWASMKGLSDSDLTASNKNCETLKKECSNYIKAQIKKDKADGKFGGILSSILLQIFFQIMVTIVIKWIISILFS